MSSQRRATKLIICLQNYVRDMLKEKLEKREQVQLELIQVKESADNFSSLLKASQDDFEAFK